MSDGLGRLCFAALLLPVLLSCSGGRQAAAPATAPVALPQPDSAGAGLLRRYCSTCHGPPQPADHTAAQWPNVVRRMQQHRINKGLEPIAPGEEQQLISYLQRNAGATSPHAVP